VRKHRHLYAAAGLYLLILFFPVIFLSRLLTPVDIFYSYDPWRTLRPLESQNPLMNDPATSYVTLISMLKSDPAAFHWNRWIASGVPGYGSSAAAVLSPFVLVPSLLLPLGHVFEGVIVLKFLCALIGMYLFLRHLRMGKRAAAVGAITTAASGIYAVWFLWQGTNATALYPWLLLAIHRIARGMHVRFSLLVVLALAFAVSGFPATVVYGAYAAAIYALLLTIRERRVPLRSWSRALVACGIAAMIALPSLVPFVRLVRDTGYLEWREGAASRGAYPLEAFRAFADPLAFGDPLAHRWEGASSLGSANNFIDATLYLGIVPLVLIALSLLHRRGRPWLVALLALTAVLFGAPLLASGVAELPGIGYSQLVRLRMLLPLPAGVAAAVGAAVVLRLIARFRRLHVLSIALPLVVAFDLSLFAARFHPYIERDVAHLPSSPTVRFLSQQPGPFRIAPMFDYLWPNTTEMLRLEDIRSHFSSERDYRAMLARFAPNSFGSTGTVIQFNALEFDANDPIFSMLNVRYVIEQPTIDILRWQILKSTVVSESPDAPVRLHAQETRSKTFAVPSGVYAIELAVEPKAPGTLATMSVRRTSTGERIDERTLDSETMRVHDRIYIPLFGRVAEGEPLLVEVHVKRGVAEIAAASDGGLVVGWVGTPLIPAAMFVDGKVFENVAALPRYWPVWDVRAMPFERLLADRQFDFGSTLALHDRQATVPVPAGVRDAKVRLLSQNGTTHRLRVSSSEGFVLATSEKFSPDLRATVDGEPVKVLRSNGLFSAIVVPAGPHEVMLERRLARGYWAFSAAGVIAWIALVLSARRGLRTRTI
jgi:hypothetical protein